MEYKVTIKDLPENERPREKLLHRGAHALSTAEILAIILRVGSRKKSAVDVGQELLSRFGGISKLSQVSVEELCEVEGVAEAKAAQIKAAFELALRLRDFKAVERPTITSPSDVASYVMDDMRLLQREELRVIILDTKNQIIAIPTITTGTLNNNLSHPRETFRPAIQKNGAGIILVHNHPSGDPTPSQEDITLTNRYVEAGKILGIPLLDHVIIGDGRFVSLREEGYI